MRKGIILFTILPLVLACSNNQTKPNVEEKDTTVVQENTKEVTQTNQPSLESLAPYFIEQKSGDILWIQTKNALSADQQGIYIYFQNDNGVAKNLRLRIQLGDNTNYRFICDGKTYNYKANKSKTSDSRFVEGGFNWYDDYVKKEDLKFLENIVASKETRITFGNGQTLIIDNSTKGNIKRTLKYFEALDGMLPKSNMVNIRRL